MRCSLNLKPAATLSGSWVEGRLRPSVMKMVLCGLCLGAIGLLACQGGEPSASSARKTSAVDARVTPSPVLRQAHSRPRREPPRPPDARAPRAAPQPAPPAPTSSLDTPEVSHVYSTRGPKLRPKVLFRVKEELYWPHVPVVLGRTMLHGTHGMSMVGLDAESGKLRWRWKGVDLHSKSCFRASPVIQGGRGFLLTEAVTLLAFDPVTGARHWEHKFPKATVVGFGPGGCRVVLTPELIFVGAFQESSKQGLAHHTRYLHAIETRTGRRKWTRSLPEGGGALVATDRLYLITRRDEQSGLIALDRMSGDLLWKTPLGRRGLDDAMIGFVRDGYVGVCGKDEKARVFAIATGAPAPGVTRYCGSPVDGLIVRYEEWRARLTARDPRTGALRWKRDHAYLGNSGYSVADGVIYLGLADIVLALELQTGRTLWAFRLPRAPRQERTWLNSPPVPADGVLHFTTSDDHIWALR